MNESNRGKLRAIFDISSSIFVMVAAAIMVGAYFVDRGEPTNSEHFDDWEEWSDKAVRIGPPDAPFVIAGFLDFTCPYCAQVAPAIDSVLKVFPDEVAFDFHHFPLSGRSFSLPSAIAAECAHEQGRFRDMFRVLFSQIDSIGSKPWEGFAEDAGVRDARRFSDCMDRPPESFERISAGRALGESIGVVGTPRIYINGTYFSNRDAGAFLRQAREFGLGG